MFKYIFVMIVFVCFVKHELLYLYFFVKHDLAAYHFYVKRDCFLFSVNVKVFFAFFMMLEKANYLCMKLFS